ncbi:hypothetical protein [Chitinophaga rhizophila]|uniref:Uncharacterized protein n=1 Tax=Chitinophaga rhizophila TaxID=2866212 RepID=A0ABS7G716_9BACT|nr:hypothetical protein [Chitinophaga rhizophila]MBW8683085.1 hypothetical protein [Chitinophaga rhizophila]
MSELSSLFVKLKMKQDSLKRFFEARPAAPIPDEDWAAWWNSRDMYSKSTLQDIPMSSAASNGEVFESCLQAPETFSLIKTEEDIYIFTSLMFSENYYEILPMLAVLKSVAQYMEPGEEGVAFIYDYFWGGAAVMAHLELSAGKAVLKHTKDTSEMDEVLVNEANAALQEAMDALSGKETD